MTNTLDASPEDRGARSPALEALTTDIGGVLDSMEQVSDYLERVVHAVRRHVEGCDEVGVTILSADRPHTAAYTTVQTLEIDAVQYALDQGPLPRRRAPAPRVRRRGPRRSRRSLAESPTSAARRGCAACSPCRSSAGTSASARSTSTGGHPTPSTPSDASLVRVAASRCADAVVAVSALDGVRRLAGQLEQAMASRAVIEQAKGVVMAMRGVSEHEAFEFIRRASQDRNVKVRHLAQQIVTGVVERDAASPLVSLL